MTQRLPATLFLTLIALCGCSDDDDPSAEVEAFLVQGAQSFTTMFRRFQAGDGVVLVTGGNDTTGGCDCTESDCTFEDCTFDKVVLNGTVSWTDDHVSCDFDLQVDDLTLRTIGDVMLAKGSIDGTMTQTGAGTLFVMGEPCMNSWTSMGLTLNNIEFDPNDSCPQNGTITMDVDFVTSCENGDRSERYVTTADGTRCLSVSQLSD